MDRDRRRDGQHLVACAATGHETSSLAGPTAVAPNSRPQLLEALLNLRRELGRLLVEVGQLGVDVPERLLEVEILVTLGLSDADITPRSKAPIDAFVLLAVHGLH